MKKTTFFAAALLCVSLFTGRAAAAENVLFSETFASGQGDFTIENVTLDGISYVWKHDASYKYMKASSFVSGSAHNAESWLISPAIDLTGASNVTLSFKHAIGPQGSINVDKATMTLQFSSDYTDGAPSTATWTAVEIPTWSTSGWAEVSVTVNVPADMQGKPGIRFAYKYATTTESATWEVWDVEMRGEGGTVTPPDPTPGEAILDEPFATSQGDFTIEDVTLDGISYVWSHDNEYEYMKASSFVGGSAHNAESWLISPALDLTGYENVTLSFEHAIGPQGSINVDKATMTLWFSSDYTSGAPNTANWTEVEIPTWSTSGWGWVDVTVNVPADMQGKPGIRFAYKYATTTESATWEIRNVVVDGDFISTGMANPTEAPAAFYVHDGLLTIDGADNGTIVEIYNALGTRMLTTVFDGTSIHVADFTPGMYIVRVGKEAQKVMF